MLQKYLTEKKIALLSFFLAIAGILLPFVGSFSIPKASTETMYVVGYVKFLFELIHVSFFELRESYSVNIPFGEDGLSFFEYNLLNAFFYILLLLGAIFYLKSKTKETRLLRFIYSLIFISKVIGMTFGLFFLLLNKEDSLAPKMYLITVLNYLISIFQIYLVYSVLKFFEKNKVLSTNVKSYENSETTYLVETSKWTRLFHHLFDYLIMILVFSSLISSITRIPAIEKLVNSILSIFGERLTILLILAFFRVFYYFVFEAALGVTAAKLLSETRVVDENGAKPSVGDVFKRTLLRLVPLEAFTFFMPLGLHDKASDTFVVNEQRTGVNGGLYFLIIPVFLIMGLLTAFGVFKYNSFQNKKAYEAEKLLEKEIFLEKIKNLSQNDMIHLNPAGYTSDDIYLKTEEINADSIKFMVLDADKNYGESHSKNFSKYQTPNYIEKVYAMEKADPKMVSFTKADLKKAFDDAIKSREEGYDLSLGLNLGDEKRYFIDKIETYFMPRIVISGSNKSFDNSFVAIRNEGWPADLVSISGWKLEYGVLPLAMYNSNNSVQLSGPKKDEYQFQFKVKDTLGRVFTFEISKKDKVDPKIKKLN